LRILHRGIRHPARIVPLAFLLAIGLGTALLMLPLSRAGGETAPFMTALFTSTSAVCVTGLIVEDTPTYWSPFGQAVILVLFQVGGFGIMTAATLLGLLVGRGFRLSDRLLTQVERNRLEVGDAAAVLRLVLILTFTVEIAVALVLAIRLRFAYSETWGQAIWNGVFHSISAFNNAGFSTYSDSLMGFQTDAVVLVPVMLAIFITALGFPVIQDLRERAKRPSAWSLHTKITVLGTAILLSAGFVAVLAAEWNNAATLGPMGAGGKVLNALFHSITPRTAGFNTLDVGALRSETLTVTYVLMFIGGGSAGTAGGIKVTTFFLLGIVVWSEVRGERDASVFGRRIGSHLERQALTVVLLAMSLIGVGTLVILSVTHLPFSQVLFETISAFSTVGLSTGITASLPPSAELVLIVLMFVGRVGTITAATALALGSRRKNFRYPEERPIVG
jgi:trk system potassium uptake protein